MGPTTIRRPAGVGALVPVPCVSICGFVVRGANADLARFRRDTARANQIFGQCNLQIAAGPFQEIDNPNWLDHPDWVCGSTQPKQTQAMFAYARARCLEGNVIMLYIRSMGGTAVGCGGNVLAGDGRPGFVNTDGASRNTFAHETGHVLFGQAHSTDPTNLMFVPSASIVVDPPRLTPGQCRLTVGASAVHECGPIPPPPPVAGPVRVGPGVAPASTLRTGLLAAEEGDLAVEGALPDLSALLARDPDPVVRGRAAGALGRLGGDEALRALAYAARGDGHPVVRLTAAHELGRMGGADVAAVLAALLDDRDTGVRLTALQALGALPAVPAAAAAVARLAERDPSPHVRALARDLAGEI